MAENTHLTRQDQADAMGVQIPTRNKWLASARAMGIEVPDPVKVSPVPASSNAEAIARRAENKRRVALFDADIPECVLHHELGFSGMTLQQARSATLAEAKRLRKCGYWVKIHKVDAGWDEPATGEPDEVPVEVPDDVGPVPVEVPEDMELVQAVAEAPADEPARPWYAHLPRELWPASAL
jgi:hypothetical protein